jgi:hypothetical protein
MKKCISDGASLPGAIRNSYVSPSIVSLSPVFLTNSVGRISVARPLEVVGPRPEET